MELNAIFLLEHQLELRVLLAVLSLAGTYGLIKLYTYLSGLSSLVLDSFRKISANPSALGAR